MDSVRIDFGSTKGIRFEFLDLEIRSLKRQLRTYLPAELMPSLAPSGSIGSLTIADEAISFTTVGDDPYLILGLAGNVPTPTIGERLNTLAKTSTPKAVLVALILSAILFRFVRILTAGNPYRKLGTISRGLESIVAIGRTDSMPFLDGLRGLAVLLVVAGHYAIFNPATVGHAVIAKYGVYLFFVLSSFLLTRIYVGAASKKGPFANIPSFYSRRFYRIFPMYSVVLILLLVAPQSMVIAMLAHDPFRFSDNLLFIYPQSIFWALSVEFNYYLVIPILSLIYILSTKAKIGPLFLLLSAGLVMIAFYQLQITELVPSDNHQYLPNGLTAFLAGSSIAFFHMEYISKLNHPTFRSLGIIMVALGALGIAAAFPVAGNWLGHLIDDPGLLMPLRTQSSIALSWAIMLAGLLFGPQPLRDIFAIPWLRFVGLISFSVYLLHAWILSLGGSYLLNTFGFVPTFIICLIPILGISAATYLLIEKPFLDRWSPINRS